jgi:hypothetical protein
MGARAIRPEKAWQVGRLIQWALRPLARPAQEAEYQELVTLYFDDPTFRSTVRETADGLGLLVLDVSEHGLVLAPREESVFAFKPADFRPGAARAEDRLLDGLAQIAIAATVFPCARDLDEDPDLVRAPVTVEEVEAQLRGLCERLAELARSEPDPQASDEERGLVEAWRIYQRRQEILDTKDDRQAARATRRIIERGLDRLRDFGCFTETRQGDERAWQPARRYHTLVQQFAATRVHEIVREVVNRGRGGPG